MRLARFIRSEYNLCWTFEMLNFHLMLLRTGRVQAASDEEMRLFRAIGTIKQIKRIAFIRVFFFR